MIFTNGPRDTLRAAFDQYTQNPCRTFLACPFFSSGDLIRDILEKGCSVKLIVRLTPATNPEQLRRVLNLNVPVRYFTSARFHSKLYIFDTNVALIGSANLTDSGIQSNREICIGIDREDARFDQLIQLFQGYWNDAQVLDKDTLQKFEEILNTNKGSGEIDQDKEIKKALGDILPSGGTFIDRSSKTKEQIYLETYRKEYQIFLEAFRIIEKIYISFNRRQQPEHLVPLRIEIDQFFSFIRETFAQGDSYKETPLLLGADLDLNVRAYIDKWFSQRWEYLDRVIPKNYEKIYKHIGSLENIKNSNYNNILDGLMVCHSFRETFRFHKGGEAALRSDFMRDNTEKRTKESIAYLIFGNEDFISRMGNCIFNPKYSLSWFGRSSVQETFGWINSTDIPICNGRTMKAMRFLGCDVETFGG